MHLQWKYQEIKSKASKELKTRLIGLLNKYMMGLDFSTVLSNYV